jgi:hypothetical protein
MDKRFERCHHPESAKSRVACPLPFQRAVDVERLNVLIGYQIRIYLGSLHNAM